MAEESDKTHRLLFGFASMIEQLIRRCLPGPWIERFDFSTLEPVSERLLTEMGRVRRDGDIFWRLQYQPEGEEEPFDVILSLEHVSKKSRWTSLTMGTYNLMGWQKLARSKGLQRGGKLPALISMVFYVDDELWDRLTPLSELVHQMNPSPPGTGVGDVVIIDVQRQQVDTITTPFEGLLKLHQMKSLEDVTEALRELRPLIDDDEKLSKAFLGLVNDEILRKLAAKGEKTIRLRSLEDTTMLAQRVERIRDGIFAEGEIAGKREGIREGERKGKREGKREGKRDEAARLFLKLYGVKNGTSVPSSVRRRANAAKLKQLETWAERLLIVDRAEDVFQD